MNLLSTGKNYLAGVGYVSFGDHSMRTELFFHYDTPNRFIEVARNSILFGIIRQLELLR
jgi:hypothetical protein